MEHINFLGNPTLFLGPPTIFWDAVFLGIHHFPKNTPFSQEFTIFLGIHHFSGNSPFSQEYPIIPGIHHFPGNTPFSQEFTVFLGIPHFPRNTPFSREYPIFPATPHFSSADLLPGTDFFPEHRDDFFGDKTHFFGGGRVQKVFSPPARTTPRPCAPGRIPAAAAGGSPACSRCSA